MNRRSKDVLEIAVVADEDRSDVLAWLDFARGTTTTAASGDAGGSLPVIHEPRRREPRERFLVARRGTHLVGASRSAILAGRSGTVSRPVLSEGEPESTSDRLLASHGQYLKGEVELVTCCLPVDDVVGHRRLTRAGFVDCAQMLTLVGDAVLGPDEGDRYGGLVFEPIEGASGDDERLATVIDETYRESLDLPLLAGRRSTSGVIEGYRAAPPWREAWYFVRHHRRDVGCLLTNLHRTSGRCELVYMGLIPEFRGQGVGLETARFARRAAARAGATSIFLGVDRGNDPAISVYARAGFVEQSRWAVRFRFLSGAGAG